MTDEQISAITRRLDAATSGPWTVEDCDIGNKIDCEGPHIYADSDCEIHPIACYWNNHTCRDEELQKANAEFSAAARTDIVILLEEVKRLKKALEEMGKPDA